MVDPHAFMDALREFHHGQGEDLKAPIFNRRVMDLKKLWELVYAHGGSNQVCLKKRWASIGRCFNPPASMTNLSFHIKRIFERYLLPFEQLHFPAKAMKKSTDVQLSSCSSCSSSARPVETVAPPFDHPVYIPKKKRSKPCRESRFERAKRQSASKGIKKRSPIGRVIDPRDFAMPQSLVRTRKALTVDDCEIQAASALQQMKGFPTLNTRLPSLICPPTFMEIQTGLGGAKGEECVPQFRPFDRHLPDDHVLETSNEIYLSNGIRVIPIKPMQNGFFPISIDGPAPELTPTNVIAPSMLPTELALNDSHEHQQSREIERLRKQVQQMQSLIIRQESKIKAAESSFVECKQCFQAIVAGLNPASVPMPYNPTYNPATNPSNT